MCLASLRNRTLLLIMVAMLLVFLSWRGSSAQDNASSLALLKQKQWQEEMLPIAPVSQQASPSQIVSPDGSGDPRKWWGTAYQSSRDGNWEIYLRSEKTGETRLTQNQFADTQPRLSPDALMVAFVSDRDGNDEIYTMNRDGNWQTRLTFHAGRDSSPYWSPNGAEILFVSSRDGNNEIYVMNNDGSNVRRMTNDGASDFQPSWSPDGTQIAWIRSTGQSSGSLWVMNRDESNQHAILSNKQFIQHPVWSPDSTKIAFDYDANGDYFNELALIQASGGGLQGVNLPLGYIYRADLWMGSWSPDSTFLYYTFIQWTVNRQQQLQIDFAQIRRSCESGLPCSSETGTSGMSEYLPDVRLLDSFAPTSQVAPLPEFMRRATGIISWGGVDNGIAGIQAFDVQYRPEAEQAWQDWIVNTIPSDPTMPEEPASANQEFQYVNSLATTGKVYLRSRALDQAGNMEPWPASTSGDTVTTIYSYELSGKVTDARGRSVSEHAIDITPSALLPLQSNLNGEYFTYIGDAGNYQIDNSVSVNVQEDTSRDYYKLPAENLISNGDFEAATPTQTWLTNGAFTPTLDMSSRYQGANSLVLGQNCGGACFSDLETPTSIRQGSSGSVSLVAPDGSLHLISITSALVHQMRTPDGDWQPYTNLANFSVSSPVIGLGAAIDSDNVLHVVWSIGPIFGDSGKIYYISRTPQGIWSTVEYLGEGTITSLAVDTKGVIHLIYLCQDESTCTPARVQYRTKAKTGGWSAETTVATGTYIRYLQFISGRDDVLHVAWMDMVRIESHNRFFYRLQYRTRSTSGNWNSTELVHSGYGLGNGYEPFGNVIFTEDATRTVHFFWAQPDASAILHAAKSPGSPWDTSVLVHAFDGDSTIGGFFLSTDPTGTIHILGQRANQLSPIYWQQQPGQSWQEKQFVNGVIAGEHQQWFSGMIATNSNPILIFRQLSEPAIRLIELNASSQTGSSTISQQVKLPSSIHKPTLAFMYQTLGNSDNGATFSVLVSEAITRSSAISGTSGLTETSGLSGTLAISTSQVYTDNQIHSWKLGWVDMDKWKGKSVTVTFEINQPVSGDSFQANLDDISLGSWETPVVAQSLPYHIEFGTSTTLTIHGDNFINSPVVHVGTVPVNSRWVDEHTLEATLPANLPAAIYDIWVKNPGESEGVLGGGLAIGKQVYLPLIAR